MSARNAACLLFSAAALGACATSSGGPGPGVKLAAKTLHSAAARQTCRQATIHDAANPGDFVCTDPLGQEHAYRGPFASQK